MVSCSSGEDKAISTYAVTRKNFENSIRVPGFVEPVNATTVLCGSNVDGLVEWLVEEGTYVEQGDTLCIIDDPALKARHEDFVTWMERSKATLAERTANLNMQYALLEAQVRSNEAESGIARLDSLELLYSSPNQRKIRELQLEIALVNKARYEKKLEALKIIQSSEIRRHEIDVQQWIAREKDARGWLDNQTVRAPKAGLVMLANASMTGEKLKLGDNVWTRRPVAILTETGRMKVKMLVSEADFRLINLNDSIMYRFDAMPDNAGYGKIVNRAMGGQPVQRGSQVKQFEMEGSIDSVRVMPDPGFTADCTIVLKEVKDVIVVPQVAVFDRDSIKVVYVRSGRGYEMRQVKTGLSSLKESIIEEGLNEGELIALTRPSERSVRRRTLLPQADSTAVEGAILPGSPGIKPEAAEGITE